jgi:hypothetical protein
MKLLVAILLAGFATAGLLAAGEALPPMEKYVSPEANFVLYRPVGWNVQETTAGGMWSVVVSDPAGARSMTQICMPNQYGPDAFAVVKTVTASTRTRYPDMSYNDLRRSPDGTRLVYRYTYTSPAGRRDGQCWVAMRPKQCLVSQCEAPAGRLEASKPLLLSILANLKVIKGGFTEVGGGGPATPAVQLKTCRLGDGSASFDIPQNWDYKDFGTCSFLAGDAATGFGFLVANVQLITPRLGVSPPNVPVSPFLSPDRALYFLAARPGLMQGLRYLEVNPRPEIAAQIQRVYTGPVQVADMTYTFTSAQGRPSKGWTFGISFGSQSDTNWRFWHITVTGPQDQFDAWVPIFTQMVASYKINDQYAQEYIARGMARLRELQAQTARVMARTREEISSMMQAAYDERQRSQDYIDYQRTNYIRGESDWISDMEGGTVYHTDAWGTRNTATGETWEGKPYDYYNYTGRNPKYDEQMQPVDSRELYEYLRRTQ